MIKFGSRTDVILDASASVQVKVGDRVKGGSSVLAYVSGERAELQSALAGERQRGGQP
jgi:phosphatidylserine decarboxylase